MRICVRLRTDQHDFVWRRLMICWVQLTLGFDLSDESKMDAVWPIISNRDVIEISQVSWHKLPGTVCHSNRNKRADMGNLLPRQA